MSHDFLHFDLEQTSSTPSEAENIPRSTTNVDISAAVHDFEKSAHLMTYSKQLNTLAEATEAIAQRFRDIIPDLNASLKNIQASAFHSVLLHQELRRNLFGWVQQIQDHFSYSPKNLLAGSLFGGFNRLFLPKNLKPFADEIQFDEVYEFSKTEAIPLHLIPRGEVALRLLRAESSAQRRHILRKCEKKIIEDCRAVLAEALDGPAKEEAGFALEAAKAMVMKLHGPAQAFLTTTLDSLLFDLFPEKETRKEITNKREGDTPPPTIEEANAHAALTLLPIRNAHTTFWKDKGDEIPKTYSRHATVHGVSKRQYTKTNCIQALMLVTSLIGYIDRFARE